MVYVRLPLPELLVLVAPELCCSVSIAALHRCLSKR